MNSIRRNGRWVAKWDKFHWNVSRQYTGCFTERGRTRLSVWLEGIKATLHSCAAWGSELRVGFFFAWKEEESSLERQSCLTALALCCNSVFPKTVAICLGLGSMAVGTDNADGRAQNLCSAVDGLSSLWVGSSDDGVAISQWLILAEDPMLWTWQRSQVGEKKTSAK